jgi:RimJ/RimL family protein N-acetyltransferase
MHITYKKLAPTDSEIYRSIRLKCLQEFPNNFTTDYETERKKEKLIFSTYIERGNEENFVLGAFDRLEGIGICGFFRENKTRTRHRGALIQIYVAREYQGQGVGKQLVLRSMKKAFEEVGVEQIVLGVVAGNDGAKAMYEKCGFKEYGRLNGHSKIGNDYYDEILMVIYRDYSS